MGEVSPAFFKLKVGDGQHMPSYAIHEDWVNCEQDARWSMCQPWAAGHQKSISALVREVCFEYSVYIYIKIRMISIVKFKCFQRGEGDNLSNAIGSCTPNWFLLLGDLGGFYQSHKLISGKWCDFQSDFHHRNTRAFLSGKQAPRKGKACFWILPQQFWSLKSQFSSPNRWNSLASSRPARAVHEALWPIRADQDRSGSTVKCLGYIWVVSPSDAGCISPGLCSHVMVIWLAHPIELACFLFVSWGSDVPSF